MSTTVKVRTARVPHMCEECQWTPGLRGVATILPGHRYLRHVAFPDGEINTSDRPHVINECVACAAEREQRYAHAWIDTGACLTFCCSTTPCARPIRHNGDHECRSCLTATAPGGRP